MTDTPLPVAPQGPDRGQMLRNIGGSLLVNALVPYLVYRLTRRSIRAAASFRCSIR